MFGKNVAAILIIIIVIAAVCIAMFTKNTNNYTNSKLKIFLTVLAGLGVFITFFFYYNVVELQFQQQQMMMYESLDHLAENVNNLYIKGISQSWDIIPKFIASMIPTIFTQEEVDKLQDSTDDKAKLHKYMVSHKVFFLWRDFVSYYSYILNGNNNIISYLTSFLQRAHSPYLKEMWEVSKTEYNMKTIKLGDLLFEYSATVVGIDYQEVAERLVKDKRYIELVDSL